MPEKIFSRRFAAGEDIFRMRADGTILITGGMGFIGAAVVRRAVRTTPFHVVIADKLTYAADPRRLEGLDPERISFARVDIADPAAVDALFQEHSFDAVVHLAAESHVDRSIDSPASFIVSNVQGTQVLLERARRHWKNLEGERQAAFRFLHVSTDEVYGSLEPDAPPFSESDPHRPNSPYAASKASSDHFARAWHRTYALPVVVSHSSNNYGPYQFPEKLIPLMIAKALRGEPLRVYGDGRQIRDWLHVDDHAAALLLLLARGRPGESYNVGAGAERMNIEVVRAICGLLDSERPRGAPHADLITFVTDRPGHDQRYAVDARRLRRELGWAPSWNFEEGLAETVRWYLRHPEWWEPLLAGPYDGRRLGVGEEIAAS